MAPEECGAGKRETTGDRLSFVFNQLERLGTTRNGVEPPRIVHILSTELGSDDAALSLSLSSRAQSDRRQIGGLADPRREPLWLAAKSAPRETEQNRGFPLREDATAAPGVCSDEP